MAPRTAASFTKADVTRAVRGVAEAGKELSRVEIHQGKIILFIGKAGDPPRDALDTELETFEAEHGEG